VPGATTDTCGVPGAPGTTGPTGDTLAADTELPAGPVAVTTNLYNVATFKPVKSQPVAVIPTQPGGGATPGNEATE
jgi:hypothetical protein